MTTDTKFDEMALQVAEEECTANYGLLSFNASTFISAARRIRDELQKGAEPVGEVTDMKYNGVRFYGNPHSGRPEGYLDRGTKLYTRANLPPAEKEELERLRNKSNYWAETAKHHTQELTQLRAELATKKD